MRQVLPIATAEASCPGKPSAPSCLNKSTPFAPAEQVECVGKAQRYFAQSDKYLACRSTTKRPC